MSRYIKKNYSDILHYSIEPKIDKKLIKVYYINSIIIMLRKQCQLLKNRI